MRLTLDPIPLEITAAADPGAPDDSPPRRRIAGLAVPYEVEARIGDRLVTFAAGSVTVDGSPPLLLGHDPQRPVGVLVSSTSDDTGLRATYAIDPTPDGDTALVQAASGSRRGLSVGADVTAWDEAESDDERMRVTACRLAETSLVALAGYSSAGVDQIAAQKPTGGTMPDHPPEPQPRPEPQPPEPEHPEPDPVGPVARAAAPPPAVITAARERPVRLGTYVQTLVRAERGDRLAREWIEAALVRENLSTNPGVVPLAYVSEMIDCLGADRPLFDAMTHAEMPSAGMTLRRPAISQRPDGNWITDTDPAPSSPVRIGDDDETILQWAWAGAASVALVERSSPSYVEEVFQQAVKDYWRDVEARIAGAFPTAASTITAVGPAVAAYMGAYRSYPDLLVVGGEAYGKLIDAQGAMAFSSGSVDAKGNATYAGLSVVASPDVAPADGWVTSRDFLEVRESQPLRLTVANVETLSMEIGVTSFYVQTRLCEDLGGIPGAVRITPFTPIGTAQQPASRESRK